MKELNNFIKIKIMALKTINKSSFYLMNFLNHCIIPFQSYKFYDSFI